MEGAHTDPAAALSAMEKQFASYKRGQLDCLLNPGKKAAPVSKCRGGLGGCAELCALDQLSEAGVLPDGASGCGGCGLEFSEDAAERLTSTRDILPALKSVRRNKNLSYALIAPAFIGQFSDEVTPGKLRSALKAIGFDGVIEVALFADILTLKEALEFDKNIRNEGDYQLTSCCCPMWIAMIKKSYNQLLPHVPPSVSPMAASGRVIKKLYPGATTVFIGPCMAKKAEAKEPDIASAVDHVLTFREMQDIFKALKIDPKAMPESDKDHSSHAGRIYARAGGVSRAVSMTVKRLNPGRRIPVLSEAADGVAACKAMLENLGQSKANFFEGMGCKGGCAGGPKAIISADECISTVSQYSDKAAYLTPIDNPYTIVLLHRLGFDTVESLLEDNEFFSRKF